MKSGNLFLTIIFTVLLFSGVFLSCDKDEDCKSAGEKASSASECCNGCLDNNKGECCK